MNEVEAEPDLITEKSQKLSTETIIIYTLVALVGTGVISGIVYYIPWVYLIEKFFLETEHLGAWGNFLLIFGFVVISFPFTFGYIPLSLGAGYLYGVWMGTATSTIGSTLGSGLCFWMIRKLLKPFCLSKMASVPYAQSFLSEDTTIDFTAAVLWRFAPIPFGFSNTLFALSSIPFPRFLLSTVLGLFPFQVMWVFLGTTLRSLTDVASGNVEGSSMQMISLTVQLFAAVIIPIYVCYRSMKKKPLEETEEVQELETLPSILQV